MYSKLTRIMPWSWGFFWFMLPISMKGSMLALWIFVLLIIIFSFLKKPEIRGKQLFIAMIPAALFAWYLVSGMIQASMEDLFPYLERKASLLLIPFMILLAQNIKGVSLRNAMRGLTAGLIITGSHLLIRAMWMLISGEPSAQWTYHGFTAPYALGAIYYSWYISLVMVYLVFSEPDPLTAKYRELIILFLVLLLMMSASRLFILITIPIAIWHIINQNISRRKGMVTLLVFVVLLLIGAAPFTGRLKQISSFDSEIVFKERYAYDTPLNGVTLRLIQWRLGLEIIQENHAWATGVGTSNSRQMLNDKYKEYNLYTGNEELNDRGYLDYNYHNQYIETLLATGIPGLVLLLLLVVLALTYFRKMLIFPTAAILITILFFFTESVLERQAGIMVFSIMIVLAPKKENIALR